MKINICKNHPLNFYGFVIQPGMLSGYGEKNIPYVTNGTIQQNEAIYVYFCTGQNKYGKYIWHRSQIFPNSDRKLYNTILRGIKKRKTTQINYMTALQLESERWGKREYENKSVLRNGCRSNHFYFQATRPAY